MGAAIAQGFTDPSREAQAVFRVVLGAIAHPGRVTSIAGIEVGPRDQTGPGSLHPAAFAVALTLMDFETPLWLDPSLAAESPVIDALRFHCGCPIIDDPAKANFALIGNPASAPPLSAFHQGTPEYPDRSTTVVMQVARVADHSGAKLTGPGVQSEARLAIEGVASDFWQQWFANHRQYPLGVDLILTAGDRVAALPRSLRVEI